MGFFGFQPRAAGLLGGLGRAGSAWRSGEGQTRGLERPGDGRCAPIRIRLEHAAESGDQPRSTWPRSAASTSMARPLCGKSSGSRPLIRLSAVAPTAYTSLTGAARPLKLLGRHEAERADDGAASLRLQAVPH